MTWRSTELRFAVDHPTAAGHFPGDPIVPGALLLDEVVAAVAADKAGSGADGGAGSGAGSGAAMIRAAKFLQIVRPGARVALRWRAVAEGVVAFECRLAGQEDLAMTGTIEVRTMRVGAVTA